MDFAQEPSPSRHLTGFAIVVALHVVVVYALVSGLAKKVVDVVRAPIETKVIEEVKKPPPPPPEIVTPPPKLEAPPPPFIPPPEVQVATPPPVQPTIVAQTTTPPPVFERPAPPPPEPAPVKAEPRQVAIGVACPTQVAPVMPRRAEQDGIGGTVRARITVRSGKVVDVTILEAKPRGVFEAAVRTAMLQYRCDANADEVTATQTFNFRAPE
ncbi:MAG: TonB family protein [Aquabacterium sp.]|nr:MAG: TonB family protein [Aquabacterium sp.]